MKILIICKKFPYPLSDGESVAIIQMSKALAENGCEVYLLAMNTTRHPYKENGGVPEELKHFKETYQVVVDNQIRTWDAFKNLFSKDSYHITRFVSRDFENKLKEILATHKFDIIQLETLYLAPYIKIIKSMSQAPVVMRAHNIEHEIWDRISKQIKFIPKKIYLKYLSKKLKRFEIERLNDYDLLIAITERDLRIFRDLGYKNGCLAAPVGYKLQGKTTSTAHFSAPLKMSFIGSLDWMPNLEGLNWFLSQIWPEIKKSFPSAEFHIAGRNAPKSLKESLKAGVHFHGAVSDSAEFISRYPLFIAPIRAGSGLRIKILEAMSLGRVVITTSMGLEGIPAEDGKHVLIADNAGQFLNALNFCSSHPIDMEKIGMEARNFIQEEFNSDKLAQKLVQAYQMTLSGNHYD